MSDNWLLSSLCYLTGFCITVDDLKCFESYLNDFDGTKGADSCA